MVIKNVELVHACSPKHLSMETIKNTKKLKNKTSKKSE